MIVYSSESPLANRKNFLRQAFTDLAGSTDTAVRIIKRIFAQRYRYSSLGLVWAFAPSLVTSFAMTLGQKAKITMFADSVVPVQFYAIFGVMMAQTFFESLNTQRSLFTANAQQLTRSRMPIEGLVLGGLGDNFISYLVKMPVLIACFLIFHVKFADTIPFAVLGFIIDLILGSAIGLLLAPINALKNDIDNIMVFLPWILFAITPVFVPPHNNTALALVYRINPLTKLFDDIRDCAYGEALSRHLDFHLAYFAVATIGAGTIFVCAWLFCRVARPYVVERYLV